MDHRFLVAHSGPFILDFGGSIFMNHSGETLSEDLYCLSQWVDLYINLWWLQNSILVILGGLFLYGVSRWVPQNPLLVITVD